MPGAPLPQSNPKTSSAITALFRVTTLMAIAALSGWGVTIAHAAPKKGDYRIEKPLATGIVFADPGAAAALNPVALATEQAFLLQALAAPPLDLPPVQNSFQQSYATSLAWGSGRFGAGVSFGFTDSIGLSNYGVAQLGAGWDSGAVGLGASVGIPVIDTYSRSAPSDLTLGTRFGKREGLSAAAVWRTTGPDLFAFNNVTIGLGYRKARSWNLEIDFTFPASSSISSGPFTLSSGLAVYLWRLGFLMNAGVTTSTGTSPLYSWGLGLHFHPLSWLGVEILHAWVPQHWYLVSQEFTSLGLTLAF